MHRRPILQLIRRYAARYPDEMATVERFNGFISAHPDCLERSLEAGHLTGSAWVVDARGQSVLLTHHRKLDIWVQVGGHADGNPDLLEVALLEAREESGLEPLEAVTTEIFDLDIHRIPARKREPEHWHYDVRFALRHNGSGAFQVSDESHDLAWVPLEGLERYTEEDSLLRMAHKWGSTFQPGQP